MLSTASVRLSFAGLYMSETVHQVILKQGRPNLFLTKVHNCYCGPFRSSQVENFTVNGTSDLLNYCVIVYYIHNTCCCGSRNSM